MRGQAPHTLQLRRASTPDLGIRPAHNKQKAEGVLKKAARNGPLQLQPLERLARWAQGVCGRDGRRTTSRRDSSPKTYCPA
jgi:hypothetical protein